jgi:hypothetical protein
MRPLQEGHMKGNSTENLADSISSLSVFFMYSRVLIRNKKYSQLRVLCSLTWVYAI